MKKKIGYLVDDSVELFTKLAGLALYLLSFALLFSTLGFGWYAVVQFIDGQIVNGVICIALMIVCPLMGIGITHIVRDYQEYQKL
jgi:hypothetical protein